MSVLIGSSSTEVEATTTDIFYLASGTSVLNATLGYAFDAKSFATVELFSDGTLVSLQDAGIYSNGADFRFLNGASGLVRGEEEGVYTGGDNAWLTNYGEIAGGHQGMRMFTGTGGVVENYGSLFGGTSGITLTSYAAGMFNSGEISGGAGILAQSASTLTMLNSGSIYGRSGAGLLVDGSDLDLVNTGIIGGSTSAIAVMAGLSADAVVMNAGSLIGGIDHDADVGMKLTNTGLIAGDIQFASIARGLDLGNSGTITGDVLVINGADGRLFNSGTIDGSVALGAGDDVMRNEGVISGAVSLGNGNDTYRLGAGIAHDEDVLGGAGNDRMYGGWFEDALFGGNGSDLLRGRAGDDVLDGEVGNDAIFGAAGDDVLIGGKGADALNGGSGQDRLDGGAKDDVLSGGRGDDDLDGGEGNDVLTGGQGSDVMTGGSGADRFVFEMRHDGQDVITDFALGVDVLDLTDFGLAGFADASVALVDYAAGTLVEFSVLGGQGTVMLSGIGSDDLGAGDFLF